MAFMHYETNQRVPDLSAHSGNSQTGDLDNQSPGALMESTHLDIIIRATLWVNVQRCYYLGAEMFPRPGGLMHIGPSTRMTIDKNHKRIKHAHENAHKSIRTSSFSSLRQIADIQCKCLSHGRVILTSQLWACTELELYSPLGSHKVLTQSMLPQGRALLEFPSDVVSGSEIGDPMLR